MCEICNNNRWVMGENGKFHPCKCSLDNRVRKIVGWFGIGKGSKHTTSGEFTKDSVEPFMFFRPGKTEMSFEDVSKFMRWALGNAYIKWKDFAFFVTARDLLESALENDSERKATYLDAFIKSELAVIVLGHIERTNKSLGDTVASIISSRKTKGLRT